MGTLFGLLLIVGAVIHYWWWLVAAAAVLAGWYYWRVFQLAWRMTKAAEARRRNDVRARADQQQAWRLAGDPRGLYGAAWSTVREYEDLVRRDAPL
jgi:hypothetical protein